MEKYSNVFKEWLKIYLENLKDVGNQLRRLDGARLKRDSLDVETILLMKIISWRKRKQKRLSKRLN